MVPLNSDLKTVRPEGAKALSPNSAPQTSTGRAACVRQVLRLTAQIVGTERFTVAGQRRICTGFPWISNTHV
ncbi:unannotated protein [freshwater metagenome]|uniref:Unannotated protein n=1 Tax=freshwater metagenome TaxID=449393 RepID=A0A6J7GKS8_9ZZZZ